MTTILVIEDDAIVRRLICKILVQQGYDILEASGGQGGIQLALVAQPDLIVCDVMMPGLDGYGVLQQLQGQPETAIIPFIFLTARSERQDIRQGMRLGADDYLTKPFTKEELIGAIASRLSKVSSLQRCYENNEVTQNDPPSTSPMVNIGICGDRFQLREIFDAILQDMTPSDGGFLPFMVVGFENYLQICNALADGDREALFQEINGRLLGVLQGQGHLIQLAPGCFCLVFCGPQTETTSEVIAQHILANFQETILLACSEIRVSASVGMARYPQDADNLTDLVALAQTAQQVAQRRQESNYQLAYHLESVRSYPSNLDLVCDLQDALQHNQLTLHYQPQFNLSSGAMVGVEALLRWEHPLRGFVPPGEILAIARANDLLSTLEQFVLTQAIQQRRRWSIAASQSLQLAINLSTAQFIQPQFHQDLSRLLGTNTLDPAHLTLELTEATLTENMVIARRRLKALKTLGIKIALDNFDQGYSSLHYLGKFPWDFLKLDLGFIQNLSQSQAQQTLIKSLLAIAHQKQKTVIATGVESQAQLQWLQHLNCDWVQGFFCSYPIPSETFERLKFPPTMSQSNWITADAPEP